MKYKYNNVTYDIPSDFLTNCMKNGMSKMEGVQLWLNDNGIVKNQEQEVFHEKVKDVKIDHGVKAEAGKRAGSSRKREPDMDKRELMEMVKNLLENNDKMQNINLSNVEREISFNFNGNSYSFTLTKHRSK